jgi:hypothetical protein
MLVEIFGSGIIIDIMQKSGQAELICILIQPFRYSPHYSFNRQGMIDQVLTF